MKRKKISAPMRSIHIRQFFLALSNGLSSPFMNVYAVRLGASPLELSIFRSATNVSGIVQVIFGILSDKIRRRAYIIALSGILSSTIWIPIAFCKNPTQLIFFAYYPSFHKFRLNTSLEFVNWRYSSR